MSNTLNKEEIIENIGSPLEPYVYSHQQAMRAMQQYADQETAILKESLKPIMANMRTAADAWGVGAFNSFADEIEKLINDEQEEKIGQ